MDTLRKDSWILISASAFIFCNCLVFEEIFEVFEENLDSHRYKIGKGGAS